MEPRLLLTTYAAINMVNNSGQAAASFLNGSSSASFTTSFLGTGSAGLGDVTITQVKTPIPFGTFYSTAAYPKTDKAGDVNPGQVVNFVGSPEPATSQSLPLPQGLQGTGESSSGSKTASGVGDGVVGALFALGSGLGDEFEVAFQNAITSSSRILFSDIDYGEKITIQAFDGSTPLDLDSWSETEYTGLSGNTPTPGSNGWAGKFTPGGSTVYNGATIKDTMGTLASDQIDGQAGGLNDIAPGSGVSITSLIITNSAAISNATGGVGFQVLSPGSSLSSVSGSGSFGGSAPVSATLVSSAPATPLANEPVIFNEEIGTTWTYAGTAITNSNGVATLPAASLAGLPTGTTSVPLMAVFSGDATDSPTTAYGSIAVGQGMPAINWPTPANITYGTALSSNQLDASTSVPGSFSYSPNFGAVLPAGPHTLMETFTPTDTTDYAPASSTVMINVLQATPNINWPTPANILSGTELGPAQLNATASYTVGGQTVTVLGQFNYNPPATTILPAGAGQVLSLSFIPTDNTDYVTIGAATTINVVAMTSTSLSASTTTTNFGQLVTFSTTVTGPPNGSTPTGSVTFLDGAKVLGSSTLNGAGQATFPTTAIPPGIGSITAVYSGDTLNATSTSPAISLTIHDPAKGDDYDGDGKTDLAIYDQTTATFYILKSSGGSIVQPFGNITHVDIPVIGDFDGDGKTDLAIYDQTTATFYILKSGGGSIIQPFGSTAQVNILVAGDFDGDGKTDLAIYDQTAATFFILKSGGGSIIQPFGSTAQVNIPVAGDFDGDGKTDLAIFDQTASTFFILESTGRGIAAAYGNSSHVNTPLVGDYDGDGKTDIGIYDQVAGVFYIDESGGMNVIQPFGNKNHRNIPL